MRYILTGGGSGGHIYPLLSFAHVVKQIDKDAEFLFVGKQDKMESEIVPKANIPFTSIATTGTKGKISWQNVKAATLMGIGYIQAKKIIKTFKPDVCIGGGGYVSVPLMLAANNSKRNIVTAVLESDQFMGKANLQLAKKSDLIFGGLFDLKQRYFQDNQNYFHVGHPRMQELYMQYASEIASRMKDEKVDNILFVGGSLGAETINQQAIHFCEYLQKKNNNTIKVTLITGKRYYADFEKYAQIYPMLQVIDYAEDMSTYYLKADLLVTRASAGVLAEATTFLLPTIAIPSPNVMRNHQFYNAEYFVKRKAGLLFEESQITGDNFAAFIYELTQNTTQQATLKQNLQALMHKEAVTKMYNLIIEQHKQKALADKDVTVIKS